MIYLLTLSALVLIGFALLGLIIGVWQALYCAPYGMATRLSQATLDGLALGSIVVSLYWLCLVGYGIT